MKEIIIIITLFSGFFNQVKAQIAVNKNSVNGASVLDFPSGTTKGIILPIIGTLPINAVNGTLLMDKNDRKVKMKQNGAWNRYE